MYEDYPPTSSHHSTQSMTEAGFEPTSSGLHVILKAFANKYFLSSFKIIIC
ncbi:hypothetical protein SAMN02745181_2275 [Rubritalea squalenifaciens DSM 18772]|uniref:Uncharacterized protein n=1 Tax=Rubritalea squalenifaciens DSM 18772 TaxID=1123071 RepID=A0A1M6L2T7_9BACT|nr:hypothetical protein SAMN02745181_2275 [Rubritalea squalenifaciens DSM 18772]